MPLFKKRSIFPIVLFSKHLKALVPLRFAQVWLRAFQCLKRELDGRFEKAIKLKSRMIVGSPISRVSKFLMGNLKVQRRLLVISLGALRTLVVDNLSFLRHISF